MPRIKKRGLDYFPIDADFMRGRPVRRIMKSEGDAAVTILLQLYSAVYSVEGYYAAVDDLFYDDLADVLHEKQPDDIRRVVELALEYGIFDATLYRKYGVLTSAEIQRQFIFATKRRNARLMDPRYCLLSEEEMEALHPVKRKGEKNAELPSTPPAAGGKEEEKTALADENVTFIAEKRENTYLGTHSIAKKSIAKQRKENPLLNGSPGGEPREDADAPSAEEELREEKAAPKAARTRKIWTPEEIERLQPPGDGIRRNLDGLRHNLRLYPIPPDEQYAIICKSNFGAIGHPVWKGFFDLRASHGKIRLPGHYLLSLCYSRR